MNSLRLSELSLDELETHRTDIEQESNALVEKIIREQGVSPLKASFQAIIALAKKHREMLETI